MALYGRKQIFTSYSEITKDNAVDFLSKTLAVHGENVGDISLLYDYYTGKHDIRNKVKEVRPEINNKITVNTCREIVTFYTGYLLSEPVTYVASRDPEAYSDDVAELNRLMTVAGRSLRDKELFDWLFIAGIAERIIIPRPVVGESEPPFEIYTLDPRDGYVAHSADFTHRPVACVYIGHDEKNVPIYNIWSGHSKLTVKNGRVEKVEPYYLNTLPIIEYTPSFARIGSFESVKDLIDEQNNLVSDRADGVEQFIQSLLVLIDANFEDEEKLKHLREYGLLVMSSSGAQRPDVKTVGEQLTQSDTQVFVKDIRQQILNVVGMPSTSDGSTSNSSNNGAVVLLNGWRNAETNAKGIENAFVESENSALQLILEICAKSPETDIELDVSEVSVKMPRRNYEDSQTKAAVFSTLANTGLVHPHQIYLICGSLFPDIENAYAEGMEWYAKHGEKSESESDNTKTSDNVKASDNVTESDTPTVEQVQ